MTLRSTSGSITTESMAEAALDAAGNLTIELGPEADKLRQVEVALAEMETRLRAMMLRTMGPSIDRMAYIDSYVVSLSERVDEHCKSVAVLEHVKERVAKQDSTNDMMMDTMSLHGQQARDYQKSTDDRIVLLNKSQVKAELKDQELTAEAQRHKRELENLKMEITRVEEKFGSELERIWEGIADRAKAELKARNELAAKHHRLEDKHEQFRDIVLGANGSLIAAQDDIRILQVDVAPLPQITADLHEALQRTKFFENQISHCVDMCTAMDTSHADFIKMSEKELHAMRKEIMEKGLHLLGIAS